MDSLLRKYIDIIEEVADPVSGKTPEEAMKDPRYISDPAFKAEVDAAASIGTQPPAEEPAAPNVPAPAAVAPVAAPTNVPRTADGVNIANMPASSAAAASNMARSAVRRGNKAVCMAKSLRCKYKKNLERELHFELNEVALQTNL